jgi:ABC-2 type transport system permease protein
MSAPMRALVAPLTLRETLRACVSLLARSLRANFVYRAANGVAFVTAGLVFTITLLIWRRVYAAGGGHRLLSRDQMFSYLALAFCLEYAMSMSIELRMGNRIRLGLIATDLLKPIDFQLSQAFQAFSDGLFNLALGLGVFAVAAAFLGRGLLPASPLAALAFPVSFALAYAVQFGICFLFGLGAFFTYSHYGIATSRNALHQTFSGAVAPVFLFPAPLQAAATWLPFWNVIFTPVSIYLGYVRGAGILAALARQLAWAVGLTALGAWALRRALRRLDIQGG